MPRTVDEAEHARRRDRILTGVEQLVVRKGYERMTIQDVIADLGISKGAFYHYFDSKPALLEALVARMSDRMVGPLEKVIEGPGAADEKLRSFFLTKTSRKARERPLLLGILAAWYDDGNAVVRQKLRVASGERFGGMVGEIVRQGVDEGVFRVSWPERTGEIVWDLTQDLVDGLSRELLSGSVDPLPEMRERISATTEAVERVLGMTGSLRLIDDEVVEGWAR